VSQHVSKSYFQQRQRNRLYEAVIKAVENAGKRGVKKKDIALKIQTTPSQVSHFLSGPANWTIDSVSDVLFAIDAELDFKVVEFNDRVKDNRYHPVNDVRAHNLPIAVTITSGTSPNYSAPLVTTATERPAVDLSVSMMKVGE
jgi:hypothetical protein